MKCSKCIFARYKKGDCILSSGYNPFKPASKECKGDKK